MEPHDWKVYYQTLKKLKAQAESALQEGNTVAASRFAQEMLIKNTDRTTWNYGNEIHVGNQILGLAALQEGDTEAAKAHLLVAGQTPGSPQLNSFGPTMTLAQALLSRGERDAVLEYLDAVACFWATATPGGSITIRLLSTFMAFRNAQSLRRWKAAIRAGQVPILNRVENTL